MEVKNAQVCLYVISPCNCIFIARRHRVINWRLNTSVTLPQFASICLKDRFQAVNNINDLLSFLWVFNSLNKDDIKNQATTLAEIYSNQLSLEIVDEMLFIKDTYAAYFKLSALPKNILAEMLEKSLIDLFPNISIALRIFLTLPMSVAEAERTFTLQK